MESATAASIAEMNAESPMDARGKALAQLAKSLAVNIDRGNRKGRSVGNEAAQLIAVFDKLAGVEDGPQPGDIPKEVQAFTDALAARPVVPARPSDPPVLHEA